MSDIIIAAIITAFIPTILTCFFHVVHKRDNKKINRSIELLYLRSLIVNEYIPLQDRLEAHRKYKELGGNSWVDVYFYDVLEPLIKEDIKRLKSEARNER